MAVAHELTASVVPCVRSSQQDQSVFQQAAKSDSAGYKKVGGRVGELGDERSLGVDIIKMRYIHIMKLLQNK